MDNSGDHSETIGQLAIEVAALAKVNLADYQNAVPILREISITNSGDARDAQDIVITLTSEPPFIRTKRWRIDCVRAASKLHVNDLDVQLDGPLLSRLTEAEWASLSIVVSRADTNEELARADRKVELLPRNQWGGLSHLPDLIAAFVQPNEPAVERVLKDAAEVLRKHDRIASLNGYAEGPKRAWEIASAIWSAIANRGLDYALPPASFEQTGQKIRDAAQVMESGLATCLDLALLFCSAFEQAGLHSLVVFTSGHAFAGVWLNKEEFSTAVVDDVTALRKRVKLNELALFETTVVTQRPAPSFSHAIHLGAQHIAESTTTTFELAVDIQRARLQRIKPLASGEVWRGSATTETGVLAAKASSFEEAPDFGNANSLSDGDGVIDSKDRLARWQRKLLDLSLRNNLLSFRGGKKSIRLDAPDAGALEDVLSEGRPLKLLARPDLMDGSDPRDQAIYEAREREDVRLAHALDALKRREVFVGLSQEDLDARLVELYRSARAALQEGGANTLFLALGFLAWTREDKVDQRYKAPLVLVPVSLNRKSVRSGFTLTLHDDECRFNPTLIEMLRQDFQLNLGIADGELPKDDAGLDVLAIWRKVSHAIKDIRGWEVTEHVVLGTFSFAKYLMWKDLAERTDQLRENPVVRHLIDTPRDPYAAGVRFPSPRQLDAEFTPDRTFCPLAADSSQLSAVLAAIRGKDFVLIGPPGTGKSQTIANLIAQCLAERKRVLFVSEKIAALDVVYRRLREVGLGDFCLELHSTKARKTDVLAQLQRSWDARGDVDAALWREEAARLKRLRDELNCYVERMHLRRSNGMTIYEAIGRVVDGRDAPRLAMSWHGPDAHSLADMGLMWEVVDRLEVNADALLDNRTAAASLMPIERSEWSPTWQRSLIDAARAAIAAASKIEDAYGRFIEASELPRKPVTRKVRGATALLARTLPQAAGHDWRFVARADAQSVMSRLRAAEDLLLKQRELSASLSPVWSDSVMASCREGIRLLSERDSLSFQLGAPWPADVESELRSALALVEEIDRLRASLSVKYSDQLQTLDVTQLHRDWKIAEKAVWPVSWMARRKVTKALRAFVVGEGTPDVQADLSALAQIRALEADVATVNIGPHVEGVWHGIKTRKEFAYLALNFQSAIASAKRGEAWVDSGYESIASGRCGERLTRELACMRKMVELEAKISELDVTEAETEGLWRRLTTDIRLLQAAVEFQLAKLLVLQSGELAGAHERVGLGDCGPKLAADYKNLATRLGVERRLSEFSDLEGSAAGTWGGLRTDVDTLHAAQKFFTSLSAAISSLASNSGELEEIRRALERLLGEGNSLLEPKGRVTLGGEYFLAAWNELQPAVNSLTKLGGFTEASTASFDELITTEMIERCTGIIRAANRLNGWCAWQKARQDAVKVGLGSLVQGIETGAVARGGFRTVFDVNYSRWWLDAVVDNEEVIRTFVSVEHEKRIRDFKALDDRFTDLTRSYVRASLCSELPEQESVERNSEWGTLRREISKKRQHLPLRELITQIPTALARLSPCLLMSPLSIAQYLSADSTLFDVVVFDEASQIPVWDAIGAIARGKQVVMVGDPKQLPPTSFFDRAESGLDNEDVEGDLESILDECIGANLPTMNLSWHYRSRSESLIAFSNHRYYEGKLVTFPSPVTDDRAVSFHYVSGVYEKGGARTNKAEAKALVTDLVRRLSSPGFRESRLTIGVVTFNSEQQALIEDLLDDARRKDPSIESYFAEVELEPVFVKNLESVQGDERDIMYFSITYGPDITGAVSMNFGPMNRDGGERRLNVAITRARQELRVFSSLRAEQMDLTRTPSKGVRDLKHFLEFAERGARALAEANQGSVGDFESPFEQAVAAALTKKGWELHSQVGVSAFRIDLAVVDPDAKGNYLVGIECDGATYHRSATARDRDKLREHVLRGLGWQIVRVWSTDWWIDADGTIEKLDVTLRQVLESSRNRRAQQAAHNEAETAIAEAIAKAQGVLHSHPRPELEVMTPKASTADVYRAALQSPDTAAFKVAEIPAETYARNIAGVEKSSSPAFMESDPAAEIDGIDANAFFQRSYEPILSRMVAHVVEREGPVLDAVLARRIARAHGWQRTGAKIQERVEALAAKSHVSTEENVGTFYWARGRGPDVPVSFRRADDGMRTVDEICMEELTSLATQIISSGFRGDDAILGMARELGLQRLRSASRERLEKAMTRVGLIEARVDFSDSEFLAFVSENALSHKDHRLRGGALWVEGSVIDPGVISQLQRWGFKNKEEKGWWRT
jgi:very-short-patch-repair endonuclease